MTATIHEVLGELRATALDKRDQGDKFERLIKAYLETDPEWSARFSNVWMWSEWPERDGRHDTGIDLVAERRDADGYAAIQCKFFDAGSTVSKGDIDSFLSASSTGEFSARYVFDTAKNWSPNAADTIARQAVPVQRVDIAYLDEAAFDWDKYSWHSPETLHPSDKKRPLPHQRKAIEAVFKGLQDHDRGKLIMACGTGKTFTSLEIAQDMVGAGGSVLFLVPSIQLLSQTLREWMANSTVDIRPFAVCSDVRVGRKVTDDADMSVIDLTEPATTNADTLVARMNVGRHASKRMTVVFSTYQSIDVIIRAQELGLKPFDLVVCDEAHRTTGVTLANDVDESAYVKVHDNTRLVAAKRLYMTATPKVFGDDIKQKAKDKDAVLADMGDETLYGPELHRLGFAEAVEGGLLADYKVLVLAVDENYVAENFQNAMADAGELKLDEAAKLIGCWNGLRKHYPAADGVTDTIPMRTAVAFARDIRASKAATTAFPSIVDRAILDLPDGTAPLRVESRHVDGTMGIHERNTHLAWLKEVTPDNTCRILTNARCLSEGVDVPALDAVIFLTPRGSQVDVVQSVGRVMRKPRGGTKELGYIILPVVVPSGIAPEEALKDNERYRVVWQVLQALRSHDDRFHAMVNQIQLNKKKPSNVVIDVYPPRGEGEGGEQDGKPQWDSPSLDFPTENYRDAMFAKIVDKVGERRYWDTWAKDVADIAQAHITRINGLLADPESNQSKEFEVFLDGLRGNLNDNITAGEAVEMLAQHLVTRPIFEALFAGYDFAGTNPVAKTMEAMLASLDEHNLESENQKLESFYAAVRRRVEGVDNAEGKQKILVELYDKFFSAAFKRTVDKLGIVYTPVEIVDFILRSADDVLRQEFGQGLTDEGVHILDGFAGTGTFMVRLLQSGLIEPHDLARKYANELHCNEILLLAYYIAAVNIQATYTDLTGHNEAFPGLILTDTFQSWEPDDRIDDKVFADNNARLERLKKLPITVIVGNPPYSVGQDSANDDNRNDAYPGLDASIRSSYGAATSAKSSRTLYDSYIRAIRWASLRVLDRGLVCFVTNGGFLDSQTTDGMRKTLASEFSAIHLYNLRGNQRTAGEQSRREGGKVFGGGSRSTVTITVLVKNPSKTGTADIRYTDIGDYLSAEEKLARVSKADSVLALPARTISPNSHGDWLNQRGDDFVRFLPVGDKARGSRIFELHTMGAGTGRDAWVYGSSSSALDSNLRRAAEAYAGSATERVTDPARISWTSSLEARLQRGERIDAASADDRVASYRPFFRQHLRFDRPWIHRPSKLPDVFPSYSAKNFGIQMNTGGTDLPFAVLAVSAIPDLNFFGQGGQFFSRWRYELVADDGGFDFRGDGEVVDGYRRVDNITDDALRQFATVYADESVSKDDIFCYVYGLLHSPDYRSAYAADLKKMLPRIPMVRDFRGFVDAGRNLSERHLGYESMEPFPLEGLDVAPVGDPYAFFAVDKKMAFPKVRVDGKLEADRTRIVYNDRITLSGIPDDAYRYILGSRSAVEWIIDRYYVKTDKASQIINDPNDWSREVGDPRYIVDLLARVVTVSLETMKIVDALPPLDIIDGA